MRGNVERAARVDKVTRPTQGVYLALHPRGLPGSMKDMAAAARPGASDGRVPCPVCGALVHPVAGRCKHCKEDLRSFRTARPAAVVALPRLGAGATAAAPTAPAMTVPAAVAPMPMPMPAPQPRAVLPPRTTASQHAVDGEPRSAWRNWPVVVIVVAVLAIVGAVGVMVWPQPKPSAAHHAVAPPAPLDHMDTNPLPPAPPPANIAPPPPPASDDPWHSQRDPMPIPPDRSIDPPNLGDPNIDLLTAAFQHFCHARAGCPDGDPVIEGACIAAEQQHPTPPTCTAARRCLARFDRMSCDDRLDLLGVQNLFATFDDCSEAARC